MTAGSTSALVALALVLAGALYIRLRWRRSPQAYRAMIALGVCYFVAGLITGAWILHVTTPKPPPAPPAQVAAPSASATSPSTVAPTYTGPSFPIPPLHFDPVHAALPNPTLTPGDTLPGATVEDVCTPGWAKEHRSVTESMRDQVYAEYKRTQGPSCCEVDHVVPLELGGSNDIKNLWPQPYDPRPGAYEKDSLENELHKRVCKVEMPLADAQKCIESNWVECWEKYVVPGYGPEWAAANRRGW